MNLSKISEEKLNLTMTTISATSGPLLGKACCALPNQTIVQIVDGSSQLPPLCDEFQTYVDLMNLLQRY